MVGVFGNSAEIIVSRHASAITTASYQKTNSGFQKALEGVYKGTDIERSLLTTRDSAISDYSRHRA